MRYAGPIERLIQALSMLPGVGEKTASRLALYVLNSDDDAYVDELCACLRDVKDNVRLCSICMTFSEVDPCAICSSSERDLSKVCVVGDYKDMVAIESAGTYKGLYHVLHGLLAPLKGIGPDDIKIDELLARIRGSQEAEI
ncbi:MAG: recombination protein RecR, partial [Deltaproteobacteria bacterium]|nr:recombination protein RecR [Deltaproteobacteria bacterium]